MNEQEYQNYNQYNNQYTNQPKPKSSFIPGMLVGFFIGSTICMIIACIIIVVINKKPTKSVEVKEDSKSNTSAVNDDSMKKLSIIEGLIDEYYYEDDYSVQELEDGMYEGLISALEDPYSTYYSEEELEELMEETSGKYGGIGAYITKNTELNVCCISGTIANAPASEVDLREGDIIYMIEDIIIGDMDSADVANLLRGDPGTKVKFTVFRQDSGEYLDFELERQIVESPTVNSEMYDNGIGYIQITEFDEVTSGQFSTALQELKDQGLNGLVLDLRANPGGNVNVCVDIAREILPKGVIVYTEDKEGNRSDYNCDGKNELMVPLVVLVNGYSASASEILAGAIKDYNKGMLLGTKTYGKGVVQRVISLSDGTAVKLTVYNYFTPNGNNIHKLGIEPDEVLEFDSDMYYDEGFDNQLERAKEILEEKIQ